MQGYEPAIDARARALIARIQRDHRDVEAVRALAQHYERHGDSPSLANLMEGWAQTLRDDHEAADAYTRAARAAQAGPLADAARAQSLYRRALVRCPAHAQSLAELEALLQESGDYTELERCLSQLVQELARRNAPAAPRAELCYRLGQLYERRLGRPGRAIAQYRAALELVPDLLPAISAARELYLRSDKAEAAADMYELQIAGSPGARERHELLVRLAAHRRTRLADLDGAVLALRRALRALPSELSTIAALAALVRERAERGGPDTAADRARAAELYFQLARGLPRGQARGQLTSCLALQPSHARAQRMLSELDAYGARPHDLSPQLAEVSQAELDARATVRQRPVEQDFAPDTEVAAWLEDEDLLPLDDEIGTHRMVPITDRPPPHPKL